MTQHTCAVCGHAFGTSTFPGGSTLYCSKACGTRWGVALLPRTTLMVLDEPMASAMQPVEVTPEPRTRPARCGHAVPSHGGRQRRWCGTCTPEPQPRRRAIVHQRACGRCNRPFEAVRAEAKFCSLACSSRRYAPTCSTLGCSRPHRAKGLCHCCYKERYYPDRPRFEFPTDREAKRKRDAIRSHRRRAVARGAESENVDRDRVGERDRWRCGVCSKKVDRTLKHPDPGSPSLDHVVPLAEGGAHTYANTRITHLRCNVLRQHRGGGEQLALL